MRRALGPKGQALANLIQGLQQIYVAHKDLQTNFPSGVREHEEEAARLRANFLVELKALEAKANLQAFVSIPRSEVVQLLRTMRYFGVQESESRTKRLLEMLTGAVPRQHRQKNFAFVGGYVADRVEFAREKTPEEFPIPPDITSREALTRQDRRKMTYNKKYTPHWILNDPEVAITKEDRKLDPW